MKRIHILMTNDDGYDAPGIKALELAVTDYARVTVVAPDRQRSSCSSGLTLRQFLSCREEMGYGEHIRVFSVGGMPADCCKLALDGILAHDMPDLIVSGANDGFNIGSDCLYSGTVAGAMEGCMNSIPSIAVSVEHTEDLSFFHKAAAFSSQLIYKLFVLGHARGIYNLNIPADAEFSAENVRITRLGLQIYKNVIKKITDNEGNPGYWIGGEPVFAEEPADTDSYWIRQGKITLTPITWNMTDRNLLDKTSKIISHSVD